MHICEVNVKKLKVTLKNSFYNKNCHKIKHNYESNVFLIERFHLLDILQCMFRSVIIFLFDVHNPHLILHPIVLEKLFLYLKIYPSPTHPTPPMRSSFPHATIIVISLYFQSKTKQLTSFKTLHS